MNFSIIRYILGWVLNFEAAFMVLPCIVALIYQESSGFAFLITIAIIAPIGFLCVRKKPANTVFYTKEGFTTVALSWIIISIAGALPFLFSGEIPKIEDALFETISGFTTTGTSILSDVEVLSKSCLFWRSFTHWIGGMGVLVFLLAILPMVGGHSISLMRAESPGPSVSKLVPRLRSTAKILYGIYIGMTVTEFLLLVIGKMPVFDALTLSFGTAGTGGFGILNDSIASYTTYHQVVITIFMLLFGVNFNVYFLILFGKVKQAFRCEEMRWYFGIVLCAILAISWDIGRSFSGLFQNFQQAAFQVASIITTTGYSTADFDQWPQMSRMILVVLMFVGACAGSTGGGIKVSRILIYFKTVKKELKYLLHPRSIEVLRLEGKPIEHETLRSANVFFITYFIVFIVSLLLVGINEYDLTTSFTAVAATLNNIGPGLELAGPTCNFGFFSPLSKFVMMFDMLIGRLEIFPIILLFAPSLWKKR